MNILIFSAIYPAPEEYDIPNDTKVVHYYAKQWKEAGHVVQVVYLHMIPIKKLSFSNLKKLNGFESDYKYDEIDVHLLEYQLMVPKRNYLSYSQAQNADKRIKTYIDNLFSPDKVFVHFPCSFKAIKCISNFDCPTMSVLHNIDLKLLCKSKQLIEEIGRYKNIGGRSIKICNAASKLLSRNCSLVLSGIDETLISPIELVEKKMFQVPKVFKIIYAGNLIKLKKVDVVLKALKDADFDYRFEIIGDGPEKEHLIRLANGDNRVVFCGKLSREETILKMREADIFVMVSSPETFGLVFLEAMAQGCIVVGSKNEGIDGVIKNCENGYLVQPNNVVALQECLKQIVAMPLKQRMKMIFSAYNDAVKMTDCNMANKYFTRNI